MPDCDIFVELPNLYRNFNCYHGIFLTVDDTHMEIGEVEQKIMDLNVSMLKTHKSFVDAYIGTEHGGFSMGNKTPLPPGYDPRTRPWYKEALAQKGTPIISKAYLSTTGDVVVTAAQTIV